MARGIWKGSLSFGLVTIGVELYNAEAPERLDLDLLDQRDMSRIGYLKINKTTGKPVEQKDIVRGYAVSSNHYVLLSDEDVKAANPRATQTIDVIGFLAADTIPLIYYAKPYIIGPTKGSEKAYQLFAQTLESLRRIALANLVIRTRQYLTAVYPFGGALVAQTLRYDAEVRKPADLGIEPSESRRVSRQPELAMAKKLVEGMEIDWKPSEYHDEYRDDLLELVKRRARGAKVARELPPHGREPKVLDLMEALRRSVSEQKEGTVRGAARRKRARKSA
ncbi:MAG TPA: Ku protein [Gemmatimonadales bacterium]|jgi:DNA end-binding protein Ku